MRNFLICVALVAAAMFGPFVYAWWANTRPLPDVNVAAAGNDQQPPPPDAAPQPQSDTDLDDVDPPAENPMIDAFRKMLGDSPAFEEHGDELRDQLNEADALLTKIKAENREAMDRLRQGMSQRRSGGRRAAPRGKPNLIVIDLGRLSSDVLHCYNDSAGPTRVFDHLASQGVRFDRYYRTSLNPAVERARFLRASEIGPSNFERSNLETVPQRLLKAGYESTIIGNARFAKDPHELGFDSWFGSKSTRLDDTAWPEAIWADGAELKLVLDEQERYDSQTIYMTEAFAFAERRRVAPFFLWLSLPFLDSSFPAAVDSTTPLETKTQLQRVEQRLVEWISELNKRRISNNSIVVITSFTPPRGLPGEDPLSQRRLQAPLIVLGPGRIASQRTSQVLATSADLAATLLHLADVEPSHRHSGASLHQSLSKEQKGEVERTHLIWRDGDREVVLFDHWRYERSMGKTVALYDLESSEPTPKNVAGLHPQVIVKAKKWLAETN